MIEMNAESLRKWRKSERLSQTLFAKLFGVGPATAWRWEHGKVRIPYYVWILVYCIEQGFLDIDELDELQKELRQ